MRGKKWACLLVCLLMGWAAAGAEEALPPREYEFTHKAYRRYESDTLTYRMETFTIKECRCYLTKIWMRDPARQIRKAIHSGSTDVDMFAVSKIEGYREEQAIRYMVDRILLLPEGSSVFFIGRYTFDDRLLKADGRLMLRFDTATQTQQVKVAGRSDLDVTFTTAHKSKGLQADYVYIINCADGKLGFPSQIEDNPLADLLLEQSDAYPFAEERRLFYVALTRAKSRVTLVCVKDRKSVFLQELEQTWGDWLSNETYVCPRCGGKLRIIDGKNGKFFGCENYRVTGCRFTAPV